MIVSCLLPLVFRCLFHLARRVHPAAEKHSRRVVQLVANKRIYGGVNFHYDRLFAFLVFEFIETPATSCTQASAWSEHFRCRGRKQHVQGRGMAGVARKCVNFTALSGAFFFGICWQTRRIQLMCLQWMIFYELQNFFYLFLLSPFIFFFTFSFFFVSSTHNFWMALF